MSELEERDRLCHYEIRTFKISYGKVGKDKRLKLVSIFIYNHEASLL